MTKDEIVTSLRVCASMDFGGCDECECRDNFWNQFTCEDNLKILAADLIENQQQHIEALLQANAGLRDTILRRDAQIEKMSEGMAQFAKAVAEKEEK